MKHPEMSMSIIICYFIAHIIRAYLSTSLSFDSSTKWYSKTKLNLWLWAWLKLESQRFELESSKHGILEKIFENGNSKIPEIFESGQGLTWE